MNPEQAGERNILLKDENISRYTILANIDISRYRHRGKPISYLNKSFNTLTHTHIANSKLQEYKRPSLKVFFIWLRTLVES